MVMEERRRVFHLNSSRFPVRRLNGVLWPCGESTAVLRVDATDNAAWRNSLTRLVQIASAMPYVGKRSENCNARRDFLRGGNRPMVRAICDGAMSDHDTSPGRSIS